MESLLECLSEIKRKVNFKGSNTDFKKSKELLDYCIERKVIVGVSSPSQLNLEYYHDYLDHLKGLTEEYLKSRPHIKDRHELISQPEVGGKVAKILHEFGVLGELFRSSEEKHEADIEGAVTLRHIWELVRVHMGFNGSEASFKRWMQREWGSVAEFCLEQGLAINATHWDSPETAIRVARKIGTPSEIKKKSPALYKYLNKNELLSSVELSGNDLSALINALLGNIWEDTSSYNKILEKWLLASENTHQMSLLEAATALRDVLSAEDLGLLFFDILSLLDGGKGASQKEKKDHKIIDDLWRSKMTPYAEQAIRFKDIKKFTPKSEIDAIGFLLFETMRIDGNLSKDEIVAFKEGLPQWSSRSARRLLSAVNFCLTSLENPSIFILENFLNSSEEREKVSRDCALYLVNNSSSETIKLLVELMRKIALADKHFHKKEKEFINMIRNILFSPDNFKEVA